MKEYRFFKVFALMAFTVIMVLATYRAGLPAEPIRLGFVGPPAVNSPHTGFRR